MLRVFQTGLFWKTALSLALLLCLAAAFPGFGGKKIDYNTQVKPILNKHCISCHGGVKKKAGFSLLTREEALSPTESGQPAIIPGDPDNSEMIRRLSSNDPDKRMPHEKDPLPESDIRILRQWIKEGAAWELHWSYRPVVAPEVPYPKTHWWQNTPKTDWPKQELDWFVWDRLQKEQLSPSPVAPKEILLQRVSMDLIGLPAPEHLAQQFLNDNSSTAYARLVDSLLASPRFGERWAAMWLDLARYADTKGYERDSRRFIWRYRDWVIKAFNQDMPYDQFLTEQLAGDLLPHPTDEQLIATGFHRNTMTNDEGGTENEEFRVAALVDRVNTTWTALMGTTFNCVQCHSHPYDPFQHKEYYQFAAFFNNTRDEDTWEDYPALRHFKKTEDSLKLESLHQWVNSRVDVANADEIKHFIKTWQPAHYSVAADSFRNCELYDTKWLTMRNHAQARLKQVDLKDKNQLIWRYSAGVEGGHWTVRLDAPDGPVLFETNVRKTNGREIQTIDFEPPASGERHDLWFLYENKRLKKPEETGLMFDWLSFRKRFPGQGTPGWEQAQQDFMALLRAETDFTPIMQEGAADLARKTHVFERGNWLVPAEEVQPGTPAVLPPMPADAPRNRLGLARWLCDKQHPLTARTMVNRVWEQLFGLGLAETLEDLGSQGIPPVHRELLDHLSWRFMHRHNWSTKQLLREIVQSSTYCQSSETSPERLAKDPRNELLSRGPRVRLSAEQLRDKALAVAGILSNKMYGEGAMPFQPAGVWKSPWSGDYWKQSEGENQYRRAVYTFVKRTSPYPSAVVFDLAPREVCSARRIRTNTPLQALTMLNDSAYVDIARKLAQNIEKQGFKTPSQQIAALYQKATGLPATAPKLQALEALFQEALRTYSADEAAARKITSRPEDKTEGDTLPLNSSAALVIVANAVLNLDDFIVKT